MPFDGPWGEGEGKIKEFFVVEPSDYSNDDINYRDRSIDDLCLQLFTEFTGVSPDETVKARWIEYNYDLRNGPDDEDDEAMIKAYEAEINEAKSASGLNFVCIQSDDPIVALYRDGEPLAAFYASYRGMYQAGGYSTGALETSTKYGHFFASDFADEPHNTWLERETICSQIAQKFLLGERTY